MVAVLHPPEHQLLYGPQSPMRALERACVRLGAAGSTLLLTCETGTGKEVLARLAHQSSPRAGGPFVPVNCGAIPEALVESELFGHARGAFTGAQSARRGRIAHATGGTLFLDEIGELPLNIQVKLLRVLQERTYEPIGSNETVEADFRLVAATNRDLAKEVEAGRFRRDLYYRLLVCPLEIPPLRERRDDAVTLFNAFWARRGETRSVAYEVLEAVRLYSWPGNVRELENLVERLSVCTESDVIQLGDLPPHVRDAASNCVRPTPQPFPAIAPKRELVPLAPRPVAERLPVAAPELELPVDLPGLLRDIEDRYVQAALARTGWNKKEAAALLGLHRTTLVEKLRRRRAPLEVVAAPDAERQG